jgi:predicted RNA-binding Zn-ribbon protein involved in translation (DUF1610 family)
MKMSSWDIHIIENFRNMVEATPEEVSFRCPKCGSTDLTYICRETIPVKTLISKYEAENGRREWCFPHMDYVGEDDDEYFECDGCGYVISDEDGNAIFDFGDMAVWLLNNCPQDEKG